MTGCHHQECHGIGFINTPKVPESLPKATETLSLGHSKKLMRLILSHFKGSSNFTPGQWTRWLSYIQRDFLWKSLLASPVNLISFCLSSTFATLSPSNPRHWRISSEASCFLCNKTLCTTAHILRACSVALKQGCFSFRHDNVLSQIFVTLNRFSPTKTKTFELSLSERVPEHLPRNHFILAFYTMH